MAPPAIKEKVVSSSMDSGKNQRHRERPFEAVNGISPGSGNTLSQTSAVALTKVHWNTGGENPLCSSGIAYPGKKLRHLCVYAAYNLAQEPSATKFASIRVWHVSGTG